MYELKDKVAVVTGGSGDIGATTVARFAEEGAGHIVVADINIDEAKKISKRIEGKFNSSCIAIKVDVSNYTEIKK